jgi:hypothetical protein
LNRPLGVETDLSGGKKHLHRRETDIKKETEIKGKTVRKIREEKYCENCGKKLHRRKDKGKNGKEGNLEINRNTNTTDKMGGKPNKICQKKTEVRKISFKTKRDGKYNR